MFESLLSSAVSAFKKRRALALGNPAFYGRLIAVALCLLSIRCGIGKTQTTDEKPSILFIAVDDMNDWVGFLGGHPGMKIHTPHLDRLAASSMVFTNAHTPAPAVRRPEGMQ
jgi:hypothetical protein